MSLEIKNEKWKELFDNQKSQTALNTPTISKISSYYFIFDCDVNKISFVNAAFDIITGYDSNTFTVEQLIEIIHPDDQPYFFNSEEKGLKFTNSLSFNEHFQYLISYSYRIKTNNGIYVWIRQQCQALEVNTQGHLTKTLVIHQKITDDDFKRTSNDYKIFDKSRNIYIDDNNCYNLTKRELQILELIQIGSNSAEIADQLYISKYTIDTHRKNILKKTNSSNFLELIKKLSFS